MTIHLKPELEALIQKDVERGPYQSADEFVEQAVQMLHEQEQWLADNHADIAAKIEEGYVRPSGETFSTPSRCAPRFMSASRLGETKTEGSDGLSANACGQRVRRH
jgi:putative addiction module CopG family antidote